MANQGVLAAASLLPIPGAGLISQGVGAIIDIFDSGKKRDAARRDRLNFYLDAAKAGSVTGARYVLGGTKNTASHERPWYEDAVRELQSGSALWQETWARALSLGPLWSDVGVGSAPAAIAAELQQELNVPADVNNVSQQSAIEQWASKYGYQIRRDAAQAVAQAAAGVGTSAAQSIAPPGASQPLLVPTTTGAIAIGVVGVILILFLVFRK